MLTFYGIIGHIMSTIWEVVLIFITTCRNLSQHVNIVSHYVDMSWSLSRHVAINYVNISTSRWQIYATMVHSKPLVILNEHDEIIINHLLHYSKSLWHNHLSGGVLPLRASVSYSLLYSHRYDNCRWSLMYWQKMKCEHTCRPGIFKQTCACILQIMIV